MLIIEKPPNQVQNSIQTLIILWPVYPIQQTLYFGWYLKSYHFAIFLLQTLLFVVKTRLKCNLSFEYLISFSNKRKITKLFPSPLTFVQWPMVKSGPVVYSLAGNTPLRPSSMREQWIFTKHTWTLTIPRSSFAARVAFSSRLRYFLFRNVASSVAFCSAVKTILLSLCGGMVTESRSWSHRSGKRSERKQKIR